MRIEEKQPYDPTQEDTVAVRLPRSLVADCRIISARTGRNLTTWRVISDAVVDFAELYRASKPEIPRPTCLKEPRETIIRLPREAHNVLRVIGAEASRAQGRHVAMWHVLAEAVNRLLARLKADGVGDY